MTYTLSNRCAKNLCKRTALVQLIIKNVVTCFLEHSVEPNALFIHVRLTTDDDTYLPIKQWTVNAVVQ